MNATDETTAVRRTPNRGRALRGSLRRGRPACLCLPILASLLFSACSSSEVRKSDFGPPAMVRVEGWVRAVPGEGADEEALWEKALDDARREAVATAVRTHMPAPDLARHADGIAENILADPMRYIDREDVLDRREEGRFFKVRLEAAVLFDRVGEDLTASGFLPKPDAPVSRIGASVAGPPDAGRLLARTLASRGFELAEVSTASLMQGGEVPLDGALDHARSLGLSILVAGAAESVPGEAHAAFRTGNARVRLWILDAAQAKWIARVDRDAVSHGPSDEIAVGKALSAAMDLAAEETALRLARQLPPARRIRLRLASIGGAGDLRKVMEYLRAQKGVEAVHLLFYARGNAMLLVTVRAKTSEDTAAMMLRYPSFRFDVKAVTPAEVDLFRR